MEERLIKAEKLASIGELSRQLGHDLRNPLAGMKNSVYLLRKKAHRLTEPEIQAILDIMDDTIEDSNRIVTSLINYSDPLHLELELCNPKSIILHALSQLEVPDRITIENHLPDDLTLLLDSHRIEFVFSSVIKNAFDTMMNEGVLQIEGINKGSYVEMSFTDSGNGMPDYILEKIFSPLVTTKAKGMGMSLAICKRIIDAHSGQIAVKSIMGRGTTFIISLPIKPSRTDNRQLDKFASKNDDPDEVTEPYLLII